MSEQQRLPAKETLTFALVHRLLMTHFPEQNGIPKDVGRIIRGHVLHWGLVRAHIFAERTPDPLYTIASNNQPKDLFVDLVFGILSKKGVNFNTCIGRLWRCYVPLCLAGNDHVVVRLLLAHGANPAPHDCDPSPLDAVLRAGNAKSIQLLFDATKHATLPILSKMILLKNRKYKRCKIGGRSPLHIALEQGNNKLLFLLLHYNYDPDMQDEQGRTALHEAVAHSNNEAIRFLLNSGASVNIKDAVGQTVLHEAVIQHARDGVIEALLTSPADLNKENADGLTAGDLAYKYKRHRALTMLHGATKWALHHCADKGDVKGVASELAWNWGLDIAQADCFGDTPVHCAAKDLDVQILNMLFAYRPITIFGQEEAECIDVYQKALIKKVINQIDQHGYSALHIALLNHPTDLRTEDLRLACVKLLLQHGADANLSTHQDKDDEKGFSPLDLAQPDTALELLLMEYGARCTVSVLNRVVSTYTDPERISAFLDHGGISVHTRLSNGNTILHVALAEGHRHHKLVAELLKRGGDPELRGHNGYTPLHCAAKNADDRMIDLLLKKYIARDESTVPHADALCRGRKAAANAADIFGNTILHTLVMKGQWWQRELQEKCLRTLIDHGANPHLTNN